MTIATIVVAADSHRCFIWRCVTAAIDRVILLVTPIPVDISGTSGYFSGRSPMPFGQAAARSSLYGAAKR